MGNAMDHLVNFLGSKIDLALQDQLCFYNYLGSVSREKIDFLESG